MDMGIDFIIPVKKNNQILSDIKGLAKIKGYSQATSEKGEGQKGFHLLPLYQAVFTS